MVKKKMSPAMTLVGHVWAANGIGSLSYSRLNAVMADAVKLAIDSEMAFDPDDFRYIYDEFRGSYWFGESKGEHFYTAACLVGNVSACQSFEEFAGRPPLIYKSKRLHIGSMFRWENRTVKVTSYGNDARGWYVGVCSYKPQGAGHGYKVDKRMKVSLAELKADQKLSEPPKPDADMQLFLRTIAKDFCCGGVRDYLKKHLTLKSAYDQLENHRSFDHLKQLLKIVKFDVSWQTAEGWKTVADVKATVGDFEVNLLPLIRAEMKRRAAAAKEKRRPAAAADETETKVGEAVSA